MINENKFRFLLREKIIYLVLILHCTLNLDNCMSQVTQEWVARYHGLGNGSDLAKSIVVDVSGNVYVTGNSYVNGYDYATIKYNSSGVQQWVAIYNGTGNGSDNATSLAVDSSGNVYVTGLSDGIGTSSDYATIKYNSFGDSIWVRRYNGPGNGNDWAFSLAVDGSGNVYVSGGNFVNGLNYDYATVKYDSSGVQQWTSRYGGSGNQFDAVYSLAVDVSGNVYVTGESFGGGTGHDYATIKYNSSGDSLWVRRYIGIGNGDDAAMSLVIDDFGNVFVSGSSEGGGTGLDYATIKYNSSGVQQWVTRYNAPGNDEDRFFSLAVDSFGNAFVTGYSGILGSDYATVKYNSSGVQQWVAIYNGTGNGDDGAQSLAVDGSGNVYVTGSSGGGGTDLDYATIKYNSFGDLIWVRRYNGPGNALDGASSIAIDGSNNVYVTGTSTGSGTGEDYATIKYSQLVSITPVSNQIPGAFKLEQNYPNPFNPSTKINYSIPNTQYTILKVYDVLGNEVATLVNEKQNAGSYEIEFEGSNLSSGIYYYKLLTDNFSDTKKMILIR